MTSNDLVIRTERNLVDVVLNTEREVIDLRKDFEDFKVETRNEFKAVRQEVQQLSDEVHRLDRTVARAISMFGVFMAFLAVAVAIAPALRELFIVRRERIDDSDFERRVLAILEAHKDKP